MVVADAHLNGGDAAGAFSRLLARISELPRSCGAVFLGDIFDLWLALPGYESEEQKQFLKDCGCELAQGYLFHKPEALDAMLYRRKNGQKPRVCETPEERDKNIRKWFE